MTVIHSKKYLLHKDSNTCISVCFIHKHFTKSNLHNQLISQPTNRLCPATWKTWCKSLKSFYVYGIIVYVNNPQKLLALRSFSKVGRYMINTKTFYFHFLNSLSDELIKKKSKILTLLFLWHWIKGNLSYDLYSSVFFTFSTISVYIK